MKTCSPEQVGFSAQRLARIRPVLQRHVDDGTIAGFVTLIARHGQIAHLESIGYSRLDTRKPMAPDTIMRMYSMTKPITSAALMMLYEEGHFQLSDPLSAFVPEFADVKVYAGETASGPILADTETPITLLHLLTHTAGLAYGLSDETPVDILYRDWRRSWADSQPDLAQAIRELAGLPLMYQPGTRWKYSMAIDVLGRVIEIVSGKSLDVFLEERIFAPLGMADTGYWAPPAKVDRLAELYLYTETGLKPAPDQDLVRDYTKRPAMLTGGSGLVSTALDYCRFAQMLLYGGTLNGQRLLGRKTVEFMMRNHLPADLLPFCQSGNIHAGSGFGLGGEVVMDPAAYGVLSSKGAFRWGGAASTDFWVDPKEDLLGIIMPQVFGNVAPFRGQFRVLTYQALVD